nr:MAG TPA: hypothetical protein [Caudoviricetes sp.]
MEKDVIKIEREQLEALVAAGSVHDSMQELNDL